MNAHNAFAACEAIVRRHDPDRFFSALFAPAQVRPYLFALYALNYELAHVAEAVREPMLGEIRLEWWREAVESARAGTPRAHDVARGLCETMAVVDLPQALFDTLFDARRFDTLDGYFSSYGELEDYAAAASGSLMQLAARAMGGNSETDPQARDAGIAYALTGLLRAVPHHAARRKLFLPLDILSAAGLSPDEVFSGKEGIKLKAAMAQVGQHARQKWNAARAGGRPGKALPALLPAALVPVYLKRMRRPWFDPFRHPANLPLHRRQWALLSAAARGRL